MKIILILTSCRRDLQHHFSNNNKEKKKANKHTSVNNYISDCLFMAQTQTLKKKVGDIKGSLFKFKAKK